MSNLFDQIENFISLAVELPHPPGYHPPVKVAPPQVHTPAHAGPAAAPHDVPLPSTPGGKTIKPLTSGQIRNIKNRGIIKQLKEWGALKSDGKGKLSINYSEIPAEKIGERTWLEWAKGNSIPILDEHGNPIPESQLASAMAVEKKIRTQVGPTTSWLSQRGLTPGRMSRVVPVVIGLGILSTWLLNRSPQASTDPGKKILEQQEKNKINITPVNFEEDYNNLITNLTEVKSDDDVEEDEKQTIDKYIGYFSSLKSKLVYNETFDNDDFASIKKFEQYSKQVEPLIYKSNANIASLIEFAKELDDADLYEAATKILNDNTNFITALTMARAASKSGSK